MAYDVSRRGKRLERPEEISRCCSAKIIWMGDGRSRSPICEKCRKPCACRPPA